MLRKGELIPFTARPGESPRCLQHRKHEGEGPIQAIPAPQTPTMPG